MVYEKKEADGSITLTGYRLKFYYDEQQEFKSAYATTISEAEAEDFFSYLRGLFPCLHNVTLTFANLGRGVGGRFKNNKYWGRPVIIINRKCLNAGILCHEVAHAIDYYERGKTKHDRYLFNILRMVVEKTADWGVAV